MKRYFMNQLKAADLPVTLRQLTKAPYTEERGDDSGTLLCKAVYPYYEYDKTTGQRTQKQIGWTYQCTVGARNNATVFVKVDDMAAAVTSEELSQKSVELLFSGFKGVWWVRENGFLELSCKAELAEKL